MQTAQLRARVGAAHSSAICAARPACAKLFQPRLRMPLATRASVQPATSVAPILPADKSAETAASSLVKFAATCGVAMAVALSACDPASASNTGGRVGGSNFSSRQAASSSVATRSTSVSHTTVIVSQPTPMFGFMPIGFMPMGMGFGYHSPASTIFSLLALVLLLFIIVQVFSMFWGSKGAVDEEYYESDPPVTVVKVQLGLLGLAKNIRSELDSLAVRADTSSPEGLHYILQETVLALMRNPDYFVYASSSTETVFDDSEAERKFNSLSLSERAKVRQETLSNVGGYTSANYSSTTGSNGVNELILVTIVLAAEGQIALPKISTAGEAREALARLGGIPASSLMGVELLWTPQAAGDTLTQTQLLADYPQLVPV